MSKDDVSHRGVVRASAPGRLTIRVTDGHKCEGCAITAICGTTKGAEGDDDGLLTIDTPDAVRFSPGDSVEVTATSGSTLRATWWALILPTLIFGGTIVGLRTGVPKLGGWSLAIGFGALALYDLLLYTRRHSLAQKIRWKVRKL